MGRRTQVNGALGLARALEREEAELFLKLRRACRNAAAYGRTSAIQLARGIGFRASGTYERAFKVQATEAGAILSNTAEHAGIVELGRRPGRKPPPVAVILLWMQEKGMIGRIPGLSARSHIAGAMKFVRADKRIDAGTRRRIRGRVEEGARQQRLSEREQFIMFAWQRARAIAKAIGIRGMKPHWVLGRTTRPIGRFLQAELRRIGRGDR